MAPIIDALDLSKRYPSRQGEIRAIDHLALSVAEGELFCLLGPNGAGKTTTIKLLITLSRPTAGTATICGHDVQSAPMRVRQSIGYASQDVIADELLTGRENLTLVARLQRVPAKQLRAQVESLLSLLELSECADRLVKTYSGGMRKKLDIAGALVHHPPILFLDEPTLGLDPQARHVIWDYMVRLNQEQRVTLFMTTHYLDEADALADRVAIMDEGRIRALGTPEELKRQTNSLSLDEVFLNLTGRRLREGAAPSAWIARARARAA